ncbi:putative membrane copper tolerance protein [Candidatus Terasakiella magnetica]|uniref:Putative membrane copper tolerance protein n=1 Tax=Candidatus Terasakiella magnetica TaxID=1867952 RepID=A0A1C3RLQ9_9PROT|nr:sulfite exporter TauE/SafE family protein [Candidatus Terasakiella magnetica]SCA58207.1 putative membrane copper tolerance protein [Candidatus Terasakiella magnetica]
MESELLLMSMVQAGLAHCTVVVEDNGGLLATLFMAGLLGSATHCMSMCAPFVLSQVTARLETIKLSEMSEFKRLTGAALLPYHFGRMTTYVFLGFGVGLLAQGAIRFSGMKWLSAALLILAALFFLGYALKRLGVSFPNMPFFGTSQKQESSLSQGLGRILKPFFARPTGLNGYFLGIGLGFLPCGLLYGALAAAGATGDFLAGAFGMAAFALGTVPSLMVVGFAGHMAGQKWQKAITDLAPMLLIINAGVLAYLAWTLVK